MLGRISVRFASNAKSVFRPVNFNLKPKKGDLPFLDDTPSKAFERPKNKPHDRRLQDRVATAHTEVPDEGYEVIRYPIHSAAADASDIYEERERHDDSDEMEVRKRYGKSFHDDSGEMKRYGRSFNGSREETTKRYGKTFHDARGEVTERYRKSSRRTYDDGVNNTSFNVDDSYTEEDRRSTRGYERFGRDRYMHDNMRKNMMKSRKELDDSRFDDEEDASSGTVAYNSRKFEFLKIKGTDKKYPEHIDRKLRFRDNRDVYVATEPKGTEYLFGIFPVLLALQAGRRQIYTVYCKSGLENRNPKIKKIHELALEKGIKFELMEGKEIRKIFTGDNVHQGVFCSASQLPIEVFSFEEAECQDEDRKVRILTVDEFGNENSETILSAAEFESQREQFEVDRGRAFETGASYNDKGKFDLNTSPSLEAVELSNHETEERIQQYTIALERANASSGACIDTLSYDFNSHTLSSTTKEHASNHTFEYNSTNECVEKERQGFSPDIERTVSTEPSDNYETNTELSTLSTSSPMSDIGSSRILISDLVEQDHDLWKSQWEMSSGATYSFIFDRTHSPSSSGLPQSPSGSQSIDYSTRTTPSPAAVVVSEQEKTPSELPEDCEATAAELYEDITKGRQTTNAEILECSQTPPASRRPSTSSAVIACEGDKQPDYLHATTEVAECGETSTPVASKLARRKEPRLWLLLDRVVDPMNLGAVLRSSCYFGVSRVLLTKSCGNISPIVSKASSGAVELMDISTLPTKPAEVLKQLQLRGWQVAVTIATTTAASNNNGVTPIPVGNYKITRDTVLVVGNEGRGISDSINSLADVALTVPSVGPLGPALGCLNVSVATAIMLHSLTTKQ